MTGIISARKFPRPINTPRARRDLTVVLAALAVTLVLTLRFDLSEKAQTWAAQHESLEIDEIFVISLVASTLLGVYSGRRVLDLRREVAQRQMAEEALRESEQRYRAVVEDQDDLIYRSRPDGTVVYANDACLRFVDAKAEDVFGQRYDAPLWTAITSENAEQVGKLEQGQPSITLMHRVERDGVLYWFEWTTKVIRSAQGAILEYQSVGRDITERKRAQEQQLQLALEREKVAMLSSFIRDASHEFRTPLAVISAGLDLAEHLSARGESIGDQIKVLQDQVMHLSGLVNALLTMSHLDTVWTFRPELKDLNDVVRDALARLHDEIEAKQQVVREDLAGDLPLVGMDADALGQALFNILQNAAIYTPEGGTIEVRTILRADSTEIEVRDTGIGIDPASLPLIFERFYRADPARTGRHAGMGLAIAKRIVEAHGGQIEVESFPGSGSVFRVVLPPPTLVESEPAMFGSFV